MGCLIVFSQLEVVAGNWFPTLVSLLNTEKGKGGKKGGGVEAFT